MTGNRTVAIRVLAAVTAFGAIGGPAPAAAYMGPGVGLSALGSALALLAALVLALVGFVWMPLKRLFGLLRRRSGEPGGERDES